MTFFTNSSSFWVSSNLKPFFFAFFDPNTLQNLSKNHPVWNHKINRQKHSTQSPADFFAFSQTFWCLSKRWTHLPIIFHDSINHSSFTLKLILNKTRFPSKRFPPAKKTKKKRPQKCIFRFFLKAKLARKSSEVINRCTNLIEKMHSKRLVFSPESERHERRKAPNTSQLIQINHKHIFTTMKLFSIADRVDDSLYRCNIYYSIFASFHTHMNIWFCVKCFNHRASEIYWHIFQNKKSV